ncbi:MAG: hypothetical protein IV100_05750 [Myxococcales bacterium]|nr:hypothetical protein [Myxococcales bacterium]
MRGIKKGKSPSNVSPAGQKSRSFTEARLSLGRTLKSAEPNTKAQLARAEFDSLDKASLRQALHQEQRGLCVYCERHLPTPGLEAKEARAGTTGIGPVAHWEPIKCAPGKALDWDNLHLSCASSATCDGAQGEQSLGLPAPSHESYEDFLTWGTDGDMKVRPAVREGLRAPLEVAIGTSTNPGVLNLNSEGLRRARRTAMKALGDNLNKESRGKHVGSDALTKQAERLLALEPLPAFVSLQVQWFRERAARR